MTDDDILQAAMAQSEADSITSYLGRGRSHQSLLLDALTDALVVNLERCIADVTALAPQLAAQDIFSEFSIRGIEPAPDRINPLVERFQAIGEAMLDAASPEQKEAVEAGLLADDQRAEQSKN